jgi:hypothetical protein
MQTKTANCILLIVSTGLLYSCGFQRASRYVYASQAADIPYFKEKGDTKLTGYYSGDGSKKNDGYNIQGAYAFTNHWAVTAAWSAKKENQKYQFDSVRYHWDFLDPLAETNIFDSSVIKYNRKFFEFGLGYFVPLDKEKIITYNLYAGVALGKFGINDTGLDSATNNYTRFYTAKMTKWWLQGSFNFLPTAGLNFSVGGRFTLLHYGPASTSYSDMELDYFYLDKINNKSFLFWEPFINFQLGVPGLQWIKIDGQVSLDTKLGTTYPKVKTYNNSIGLTFDISNIRKPKDKDKK